MSWAQMVAVVALAWPSDPKQPAARVRVTAIAAQIDQGEFAADDPDGGLCASGPFVGWRGPCR
jgi:hypothetical protein